MKRTYILNLLLVVLTLIHSCSRGNRNDAERKIEGKWKLLFVRGPGDDTSFSIEYAFNPNMEYTLVSKEKGQVTNTMNGTFAITKDSLALFYPPHATKAIYKAGINSLSADSLVLYDGFSEKHFGRF